MSEWDDNVTLQLTTTTIAAGLWIISPLCFPGSLEKWNHSHHKAKAANAEKLACIRRRKQHADNVSRGRMYIRLAQKAALVGNKVRGATISLNQSSADDFFFFVGGGGRGK